MSSKEKCESSTSLYLCMEAQRKDIPDMCKDEYIPIFVVDVLRDLLVSGKTNEDLEFEDVGNVVLDDSPMDMSTLAEMKCMLPEDTKKHVYTLIRYAEEAFETFKIDKRKFRYHFTEAIEFPCLELLWILNTRYNLQEISSYLMHLELQAQLDHFAQQFVSFCFSSVFDSKAKSVATQMLYDFMEVILIAAYCNPLNSNALERLEKESHKILKQICDRLISTDSSRCSYITQQFLLAVFQEIPVTKSVKNRFFSHQISHYLTVENSENAMYVIQHQERLAQPSDLPQASFFAMEAINSAVEKYELSYYILKAALILWSTLIHGQLTGPPQSCQEVLELLEKSLSGSVVHWENALLLMTEWIKRREYEAISLLKERIKRLMKTGLSSKSEEDVITAFILARHCSLVAPREFLRYEKWYTNMFESEVYSPAKDPEAFNFLTNLLSKWIPLEPPCFLQVHATFWPYVPAGCRKTFADYVSLAKVRIAEYNEVERAMEFEPNPNNPLLHDVEMAIKTYDNTKKTPQSIGQMWMFRKQYYLENFLPALLKKPTGATLTDARLRLIEVLNKEGKIPPDVYTAYKMQNQLHI